MEMEANQPDPWLRWCGVPGDTPAMKSGPVTRLGLIVALVGAALVVSASPVAAGGSGCGQWGALAGSGRVGDSVLVRSGALFDGSVVDVRLGSTILVTAPLIGGAFEITVTIPGGTPAGATTIAVRTRFSAPFTSSVTCDWTSVGFTVLPSVSLSTSTTLPPAPAQTTTTTAAPAQTSSTTSTTVSSDDEAPVTSTTTTSTSAATTTTVASTSSTMVAAAAPLSESSGSGGLPSILVVLLGAAGGAALFVGGMLFERKTTGSS